jgi:hypothetical protein
MDGNGAGSRWDLLLHPVRTRIVAEFSGRRRTVRELAAALPDVPQTTLYRQVGVLVDGGVLEVVDQRATGGPAERVYRVAEGADRMTAEEIDRLTPEEHARWFSVYTASLADAFSRYVASDGAVPSVDGLGYQRAVVHLTEAERAAFGARVDALVADLLALPPDPARRPYHLASIVVPEPRSTP